MLEVKVLEVALITSAVKTKVAVREILYASFDTFFYVLKESS